VIVSPEDEPSLPLVTFHLPDERQYDEYHIADKLRTYGWVVPRLHNGQKQRQAEGAASPDTQLTWQAVSMQANVTCACCLAAFACLVLSCSSLVWQRVEGLSATAMTCYEQLISVPGALQQLASGF